MIYDNYMFFDYFIPKIPSLNEKPPTLYSLLESIVNYGKDEKQKIKDLAKYGRTTIFDFDYPLSDNVSKEDFETIILNHFLMRRIGFETLTAFKIQLNVKLNEIMPIYNKLFDSIENWNILNDGEKITRTKNYENTGTESSQSENEIINNSQNTTENIQDKRSSDTPQTYLENVQEASYVTNYEYNKNNTQSNDESNTKGTAKNTTNNKNNSLETEIIERTPADKINIYKEFQENVKSIYSMIFKDLNCLFYGLL